jgi:predicted dehydrogenase
MKSLIIGMGIGNLYKEVLTNLGAEVITVDLDPSKAMYTNVEDAVKEHKFFDTAHICTPNFTHKPFAKLVADVAKIVFVEKPGVKDSQSWLQLTKEYPFTRFMMVKNNMWRSNVGELKELASQAKQVNIQWIRKNCIPHPGSWFTTKELAFGGVSRDLMPHMLSWYVALNPHWQEEPVTSQGATAQWLLKDIDSTEYGVVNPNGTYDVDDKCHINFGDKWNLQANWRSMDKEDSSIEFIMPDNTVERFELGWCPAEAYQAMIADAVKNVDNDAWFSVQLQYDLWIHTKVEEFQW